MKKKVLFSFFLSIFFITSVSAASYYKGEEGTFWLCDNDEGPCFKIIAGQQDVNFDLKNELINYNGEDYYFNEWLQEEYDDSLKGISKMYYYEKNGKYVLCDTHTKCKTYSFDELMNIGAQINYHDSITFWDVENSRLDGLEYFYNDSFVEQEAPNGTEGGENLPAVEKTTYTAKTDYCERIKEPLQFIGNIVFIIKIIIPTIIIILGVIDFFKAVTGAKDDEIKKSSKSFLFRCIAGVIIFFIPTIVSLVFSLVASFADVKGDFDACQKCIFRVSECK